MVLPLIWNWFHVMSLPSENNRLLKLAVSESKTNIGRSAGQQLLKQGGAPLLWNVIKGKDAEKASAALASIKGVGSKQSLDILKTVALDSKMPIDVRSEAARSLRRYDEWRRSCFGFVERRKNCW